MKIRLVCLVSLFVLLTGGVMAQDDEGFDWWRSACDSGAPENVVGWIAGWLGAPAFERACTAYTACVAQNAGYESYCEVPVYEALTTACDSTERFCQLQAAYGTASLLQTHMSEDSLAVLSFPILAVTEVVPVTDDLFTAQVDELLGIADIHMSTEQGIEPLLYLAVGAAHEFVNEMEAAEAAYSAGLSLTDDPLLLYRRGLLYCAQGKTELAALDGFLLKNLVASQPYVAQLAASLTSQYPLDESRLEDWLVYDELRLNYTVGGDFIRDLSTTPPRPVRLARYANDTVLLVIEDTDYSGLAFSIYRQISSNTFKSPDGQYLTFMGDTAFRSNFFETFEAGGSEYNRLAKTGIPDPRPESHRCENGARWFLSIGAEGRFIDNVNQDYSLYEAPSGPTVDESVLEFKVVDGPVCLEGTAWWGVQDLYGEEAAKPTYWLPEAEGEAATGFTYQVITSTFKNSDCPGALHSPLYASTTGYVVKDIDPIALHADPYPASPVLAMLEPGTAFTVGTAHTCYESIIWRLVDYNGVQGWIQNDDGTTPFVSSQPQ